MSSLTGSGGCELQGQVGTVWSKRPLSWRRVVFVGLFQEVRSWQNEQVSGFHVGPSAGSHLPPGWRVDGVGGVSFFLKQPSLSSGSQAPAAPSVFTAPRREEHPACPRDGHCVVTQARCTHGLPSLGTYGGSGTELCALWDSALYPDSGHY